MIITYTNERYIYIHIIQTIIMLYTTTQELNYSVLNHLGRDVNDIQPRFAHCQSLALVMHNINCDGLLYRTRV